MAVEPKLDPRGLKRICMSCGTRFYDMNKRPIVCPSCGEEFTGDAKVKSRRSRSSVANDQVEDKSVDTEEEDTGPVIETNDDDSVVSFEDVDDGDDDDMDDDTMDLDDDDLGDLNDLEPDADDIEDLDDSDDSDKD